MTKKIVLAASILVFGVVVMGAVFMFGPTTAEATTQGCRHVSGYERELQCDDNTGYCTWVTVHKSGVECGSSTN